MKAIHSFYVISIMLLALYAFPKNKDQNNIKEIEIELLSLGFEVPDKKSQARNFTLTDLNGKKVSLNDFKGKVVLLNFWATWCSPCIQEIPALERLKQKMHKSDFEILTVDTGGKVKLAQHYIKKFNSTFPVLMDNSNNVSKAYNITFFPTTFIIDKKGRILAKAKGVQNWTSHELISLFSHLAQ